MWHKAGVVLILGYLVLTRSFAYVGIPQFNLFVGEVFLGLFLLRRGRFLIGNWLASLVRPTVLSGLSWTLFVFLGYGFTLLIRGLLAGESLLISLQQFSFHYYPFYLFIGFFVALRRPDLLSRFVWVLAWFNGIYGLLYLGVLNRLAYAMPAAPDVSLFGQPGGSVVAMLGLLSYGHRTRTAWLLLLLNGVVMLGMQVRADWLAFSVGILIWAVASRAVRRVMVMAMFIALLVGGLAAARISLPSPETRGGQISARDIIARAVAPLDPALASSYSEFAPYYIGTSEWRLLLWRSVWKEVHKDGESLVFGLGYGWPMMEVAPHVTDQALRSPHNVMLFALLHGGWLGVLFFLALQLALMRLSLFVRRVTGSSFPIALWAATLAASLFSNYLETPFGAIPFYMLLGLAAGTAVTGARPALKMGKLLKSATRT